MLPVEDDRHLAGAELAAREAVEIHPVVVISARRRRSSEARARASQPERELRVFERGAAEVRVEAMPASAASTRNCRFSEMLLV